MRKRKVGGSEQKHKERGTSCRQRNAHIYTQVNTGVHGGGRGSVWRSRGSARECRNVRVDHGVCGDEGKGSFQEGL